MRWLLWKDYRNNRMVLGMAIFLLMAPHLWMWLVLSDRSQSPEIPNLAIGLLVSSAVSLGFLQLALAFLGGNLIAGERYERSAEFLAYLPVSRWQVTASKFLAALGLLALMWVPNLLLAVLASRGQVLAGTAAPGAFVALRILAFVSGAVFGAAWLGSSEGRSPSTAACLGILAPVLAGAALWAFVVTVRAGGDYIPASLLQAMQQSPGPVAETFFDGFCSVIALIGLSVGTWKYLRRLEP